jgi:hypothetical protein
MRRLGIKRRSSPRFQLHPDQHKTINSVAQGLRPTMRHPFLLRVSRVLQLSAQTGFVSGALVSRAIDAALRETGAAG